MPGNVCCESGLPPYTVRPYSCTKSGMSFFFSHRFARVLRLLGASTEAVAVLYARRTPPPTPCARWGSSSLSEYDDDVLDDDPFAEEDSADDGISEDAHSGGDAARCGDLDDNTGAERVDVPPPLAGCGAAVAGLLRGRIDSRSGGSRLRQSVCVRARTSTSCRPHPPLLCEE